MVSLEGRNGPLSVVSLEEKEIHCTSVSGKKCCWESASWRKKFQCISVLNRELRSLPSVYSQIVLTFFWARCLPRNKGIALISLLHSLCLSVSHPPFILSLLHGYYSTNGQVISHQDGSSCMRKYSSAKK